MFLLDLAVQLYSVEMFYRFYVCLNEQINDDDDDDNRLLLKTKADKNNTLY